MLRNEVGSQDLTNSICVCIYFWWLHLTTKWQTCYLILLLKSQVMGSQHCGSMLTSLGTKSSITLLMYTKVLGNTFTLGLLQIRLQFNVKDCWQSRDESWPDLSLLLLAVNQRPTRLRPWYFFTRPEEMFFDPDPSLWQSKGSKSKT